MNFTKTVTDIGYGLRPEHPLEKAKKGTGGKLTKISFDDYAKSVSEYTVEKASEISGVPAKQLEKLAKDGIAKHWSRRIRLGGETWRVTAECSTF